MYLKIYFDRAIHYFTSTWLRFFTALLVLLYIINCFTPLRLEHDSIRYFALLELTKGTEPAFFTGRHPDFFPLGYVYFLVITTAIAHYSSLIISLLQLCYLGGSLYFIKKLFPAVDSTRLVFFTLINFLTLKLVITPLSEIQFVFFTCGALYYFDRFQKQQQWKWLLWSALFCAIAMFTRLAGVALVAALIITLLISKRRVLLQWVRTHIFFTAVIGAGCIWAVICFFSLYGIRSYVYYFSFVQQDVIRYYTRTGQEHLVDFAEIFVNTTLLRTSGLFPWNAGKLCFMLFGLLALLIVVRKLVKHKAMVQGHIRWYLLLYALMLVSWPFADARFWFPLMPLVIALLLQTAAPDRPVWLSAFKLYYITSGLFMILYTSWFLFDKRAMAEVRHGGKWKNEYLYHFYKELPKDSLQHRQVVYILEKYD